MSASKPPVVVAVVEDDPPSRTALGRLLRAAGFEPALFESAEAYIDATLTPTCLVVDVQLPGISGIELQQRLRAAGLAPPIIVTTSRRDGRSGSAEQNGCAAFFWKPIDGTPLAADHRLTRESIARRRALLSTRPRVLIADDYPDMVKAISRLLALDCEIVGNIADGSGLLEAAQRLAPDVVVLDVNLANVDSLEACREITRTNPGTKVIMFTAMDIFERQPGVPRGRSICLSSRKSRLSNCC